MESGLIEKTATANKIKIIKLTAILRITSPEKLKGGCLEYVVKIISKLRINS